MKANEWTPKFVLNMTDAITEFVGETVKLVEDRTRKSTKDFRGPAIEGALREQKQKWTAISSRVAELPDFTKTMENSEVCKPFIVELNTYLSKKNKQTRESAVMDGRELAAQGVSSLLKKNKIRVKKEDRMPRIGNEV